MFGIRAGSAFTLVALVAVLAVLLLGAAKPGESAGPTEQYVVRGGDTLWSIAEQRYDGDPRKAVWQIRRANELGKGSIWAGQILDLPAR